MKNYKKIVMIVAALMLIALNPAISHADSYSAWDSGYSDYDYSDYSGYSDYDYYSSGYSDYDYDTYSGYSDYDYYGDSGYSDYSYDYYSGYSDYDFYDDYSGYSDYDYYGDSGYSDYDWYESDYYNDYDWYDDDDYYYDDYDYYDDDYYNGGSNCGSNCYNPRPQPCRTNCTPDRPNPPQPKTLNVICVPSDRTIEKGDSVTFEAEVTGGTSPYTYRWTGDVTSSSRTVTARFDRTGTFRTTVKVTDSKGRTDTAECEVRVEKDDEPDDFDAICVPSKTTIDRNERITLKARVDGGDRPYDYDWSGDADGDDDEITVRFSREGTYEIDLKVTDDDGRVARDTCEVRVRDDDDDDDRDVNVITTTQPYVPPTVGSVYLNQVPYTGPEDVAKGVAFVGILLAWSVAGAMILRKKKTNAEVANRIAAFKEANKLAKA